VSKVDSEIFMAREIMATPEKECTNPSR